ncbi:MAG: NAD(P)-dependent oxidoreductase [Gemmataceae bacterium]|nr:NAD(P)-dependent oxidoreductase [Gemmata sp.]MDW8197807.1 NAD(P)-dependent oxidoreductase [Gemmataceae bacterium]
MKRLLITGGTGFIGQPCARVARSHFDTVDAVGRALGNILDPATAVQLMETLRPTHWLHLAWIATPGVYWHSPENHRWVEASQRLLMAFARCGGQRAVLAGSCAEYDWRSATICHESQTPTRPQTTYGRCKWQLGQWALALGQARGLSVAWARLFWLYGPREHPARLVPSVTCALLAGQPAACSHGTQERDFLHVHDAAEALVRLVGSELTGAINIGSGQAVAIRTVIDKLAQAVGRPELVRFGQRETATTEPPLLVADVTRLRDELGWQPRIHLVSGLQETVAWWKHQLNRGGRKCA